MARERSIKLIASVDCSLRVGLVLDLGGEIISDVAGVVSDLVLDDQGNVGGHGQRHLGREWRRFAEEIEVAKGKSQRHLEIERVS